MIKVLILGFFGIGIFLTTNSINKQILNFCKQKGYSQRELYPFTGYGFAIRSALKEKNMRLRYKYLFLTILSLFLQWGFMLLSIVLFFTGFFLI
jgi:hypothetical protein